MENNKEEAGDSKAAKNEKIFKKYLKNILNLFLVTTYLKVRNFIKIKILIPIFQ
jgi:hypothetical protein